MFGTKLSWCQIVRCQIVLVPNCPGAKLSTFIILVPNCPLLLSWCQIVPFIILVPNCPVPNCPVPNCPTISHRCYFRRCCYAQLLQEETHFAATWPLIIRTPSHCIVDNFLGQDRKQCPQQQQKVFSQ